jgi:hypothetical protein
MNVEQNGRGLDQIKNYYGSLFGKWLAESRQYFSWLNSLYLNSAPAECEENITKSQIMYLCTWEYFVQFKIL